MVGVAKRSYGSLAQIRSDVMICAECRDSDVETGVGNVADGDGIPGDRANRGGV